MAVTNYYSVNSVLLGKQPSGAGRVDYLSDALGSVTATVNASAAVVNTYRYKPYGTQLAKTGTGTDPAFTWVGQYGYRQTNRQFSDVYVRARHYASLLGKWTTKDLKWPSEPPFNYVYGNPVLLSDWSGTEPCKACRTINGGCGDQPMFGPCSPSSLVSCKSRCTQYGTRLIGTPQVIIPTPITPACCCCPCLCKCDDLDMQGRVCPAFADRQCAIDAMKDWLYPKKPQSIYELGDEHPNSGDPAKECGFCSKGYHFQFKCKVRRGGHQPQGLVITSKCCQCEGTGFTQVKCETTQGCHKR